MKTNLFTFAICGQLLAATYCQAQDTLVDLTAKNGVYLEVGGTSIIYSLNYDRLLKDFRKWKIGGRLGLALLKLSLYDSRVIGELYALKGNQNHYFELGLGTLYRAPYHLVRQESISGQLTETSRIRASSTFYFFPRIGYRFQKSSRGLLFRAGFTPLFFWEYNRLDIMPWGGLSIGRNF